MVEASDLAHVADRIRLHVHLAAPRRLLLLGDRTARALLPTDGADRSAGLRPFSHDGGTVPAIATFHPRLLLSQPAAKAECWRALQSLIEEDRP
jgi:DNA polymerase